MTSLLTNTAALSALRLLNATQASLATTQTQISSGLKVATASDNAAYWSIGVTMRSQVSTMAAVSESLDLTNGILQVARKGLDAILGAMNGIKDDIVQARQPGIDRNALQADIEARQQVMKAATDSASFNGINLIKGDSVEKETTVETVTQSNGVLISGTGTDTYDLVVKGQDHRVVDDFDLATGYTHVQQPDYNPNSVLKVPLSVSGTGLDDFGIDLDALNMRWGYDYQSDAGWPHGVNDVTVNVTDISDPSRSGPSSQIGYSNLGRSGQLPWQDPNADVLDQETSLHTVQGTARLHPGETYASSPGLAYDFSGNNYPYGRTPILPNDGDVVTLYPFASVSNLSVADRKIIYADGTPSQAYVLSDQDLDNLGSLVDNDIKQVISASTKVASYVNLVADQKDFSSKLQDAITAGIGSLSDADMSVASTRLQALQTQQQLGIQSLSIANQNSQLVLKLFGVG